jgi:hypothetical protein
MDENLLMLTQAGLLFRPPLSASRVRQLVDSGALTAIRTSKGYRLVRREDVLALVAEREARTAAAE